MEKTKTNKKLFGDDIPERSTKLFLVGIALMGIALLTVFAVWNYTIADYIPMIVELILAVVLITAIFLVGRPNTYKLALLLGTIVITVISFHNFATGGFEATGIMMVFLFPPIIFVLQGFRRGLWWSLSFIFICLVFVFFRPWSDYFIIPYTDFHLGMFFLVFSVSVALILFYEYTNEKIQSDLKKSFSKIIESNKRLEKEIVARQQVLNQLEESNKKMEQLNSFMVGRELKMKQLKEEITNLKKSGNEYQG